MSGWLQSATSPLYTNKSYCDLERIHICLAVTSERQSVTFHNLQLLSPLVPAPPSMFLLSTVETVRKTAFSTSTPMRLLHHASVTHQATGHLRRRSVSQILLCVCVCAPVSKRRMHICTYI